jgi:hypothetical protein
MPRLKYYCCLLIVALMHTVGYCQNKPVGYSSMITSISGQDTIKYLYQLSTAGDLLYVYQAGQGVSVTLYQLKHTSQGSILHSQPLQPGQQMADSITVAFDDARFTVIIAGRDYYTLFPAYYAKFKNMIQRQHQIIGLLELLSDPAGDYPIVDLMPLFAFIPPAGVQVKLATITTQRNQAVVSDHWTVRYHHRQNRLNSVSAANREEVRFTKKINYRGREITIRTYLNIEDRQITTTRMSYKSGDLTHRRMYQHTEETGKNRETTAVVRLIRRKLGRLPDQHLSEAEIRNLLKR